MWPLVWNSVPIFLPADAPYEPMPGPEYIRTMMKWIPRGEKNGIMLAPAILREIVNRHSDILELLKEWDWVGYGGAPLDDHTGDVVSQYVRLQSIMGSTDCGPYWLLLNEPEDWKYTRFSDLQGFCLEPFLNEEGKEQLFELCVRRMEPEECRSPFLLDPTLKLYHTKDLFAPVPGRAGYWKGAGRIDDFVKLSSLTKFNSIQIESVLESCDDVDRCLVGGNDRNRPWVIVQLGKGVQSREKFWNAVEKANSFLYGEAKIDARYVLFTDADRPVQRTAKGSVDRRKTVRMYEAEIERLYKEGGR